LLACLPLHLSLNSFLLVVIFLSITVDSDYLTFGYLMYFFVQHLLSSEYCITSMNTHFMTYSVNSVRSEMKNTCSCIYMVQSNRVWTVHEITLLLVAQFLTLRVIRVECSESCLAWNTALACVIC
jgi:hypothetical protein